MAKIFPSKQGGKAVHMMSLHELEQKYDVDVKKGLSTQHAKELLEKYGKLNQMNFSYWSLVRAIAYAQTDLFSILLWISFVLFVLIYKPLDGESANLIDAGLVLMCLVLKSMFIGLQQYKLIQVGKKFQAQHAQSVSVLRDMIWRKMPSSNLVIGDIIEIGANQRLPADVRLFLVDNLHLDKSIITGESEPIEATQDHFETIGSKVNYLEAKNMAFTNFLVIEGYAQGIVVSAGRDSPTNKLAERTSASNHSQRYSPINKGLNHFAFIDIFGSSVNSVIYLIVWACWIRTRYYSSWTTVVVNILNIYTSGLPIGLPLALISGLYVILRKLRKSHILVKNVFAVTSMSGIDVVLTDKTGTLTRNTLHVSNLICGCAKEIDVELFCESPESYMNGQFNLGEFLDLCDFCFYQDKPLNVVDRALFEFAENVRRVKLYDEYETVNEIEFSSKKKYQARLIKLRSGGGRDNPKKGSSRQRIQFILMIRGANEFLVHRCKHILNGDNGESLLDESIRDRIEDYVNQWSLIGRRLVCLCRKTFTIETVNSGEVNYDVDFQKWFDLQCSDLTFVGLVAFNDPLRPGIKESVTKIREMGVRVVMATGDYSMTAASIAVQAGILTAESKYDTYAKFRQKLVSSTKNGSKNPRGILLNGIDIERLSKQEWVVICRDYIEIILSRATPNDKLTCVREFQHNGHSVLMVGDGFNDVPALKRADLSVAMASGLKVVSDLSNVVLLNNSFASVCDLLSIGRHAFVNIRKMFILSMITSVFSQYAPTLLTSTIGIPQLYTNLQMTIVNAITDVLPSVSLFFERPEMDELGSRESLINVRVLIIGLLYLGPLTTLLAYMNYFLYLGLYANLSPSDLVLNYYVVTDTSTAVYTAQTVAFYSIVIMQCFGNLFSVRTKYLSLLETSPWSKPYRNWYLIASSVFVACLVTVMVSVSVSGLTKQIPILFYGLAWACSVFIFLLNEFFKFLIRRFNLKY